MVWHPCHTHAAQFCVFCEFCVRTAHHNHLCSSVPSVGEKIFPQNAHTEPSGREEPPTDGTDVHRLGGYGIPAIPTLPNSVYSVGEQRTITICVHPCHPWEKRYSRRTHTRNLLAEKSLPQMSTDVHRLGGYGIPAIPTLPNSVYSVGEQRTITICVHPCHPWEKRYSRRTHTRNLLAEKSLPQMSTDVHRLGGYGIPAIPTLPNSVYSVNSVGEQRTLTICVHPCHPWESFLCKKVLCVPCIPWEE